MDIAALCLRMDAMNASDLFLSVGRLPSARCAGAVSELTAEGVLSDQDVDDFFARHLSAELRERLSREKDLDLGVTLGDGGRFRLNLSYQRGKRSFAIRRIPSGALDAGALMIPAVVLKLVEAQRGLVLVTGATGSGKTTTMACMLHHINTTMRKHVVTIEDPIEFTHDDRLAVISQREIGNDTKDFATALRHVVRQNPDVIFIGEMRDQETVEIGLRAAITGHLVLTTLHTNDAVSTVSRLLDMGAAPYLLASSINAVLAQRLVRRICPHCVRDDELGAGEGAWARARFGGADHVFRRGEGCHHCSNTGYRGRLGVYEMLEIDAAMGQALAAGDLAGFATLARGSRGYRPLALAALDYAVQGLTTVAEAMRIATDVALEDAASLDAADARAA